MSEQEMADRGPLGNIATSCPVLRAASRLSTLSSPGEVDSAGRRQMPLSATHSSSTPGFDCRDMTSWRERRNVPNSSHGGGSSDDRRGSRPRPHHLPTRRQAIPAEGHRIADRAARSRVSPSLRRRASKSVLMPVLQVHASAVDAAVKVVARGAHGDAEQRCGLCLARLFH